MNCGDTVSVVPGHDGASVVGDLSRGRCRGSGMSPSGPMIVVSVPDLRPDVVGLARRGGSLENGNGLPTSPKLDGAGDLGGERYAEESVSEVSLSSLEDVAAADRLPDVARVLPLVC